MKVGLLTVCLVPWVAVAAMWNGQTVKEEPCRVSAVPFNRVWPGYQRSLDQTKMASFVSFDVDRPGDFSYQLPQGTKEVRIRPFRRDQGTVKDGVLTVRVEKPEQFVVEAGGTELHVFADAPWKYEAKPGDRYFGPGEHEAGAIVPKSGERIVLDRGAVVYGNFVLTGVTNVTIEGRGILDTSRIPREQPDWPGVRHLDTCGIPGVNSVWGTTPVYANRCLGLSLSGIVFRDAPRWTMNIIDSREVTIDGVKLVGMWRYNSDGIDICACEKTVIRNSFLRTFDDCVIARPQIGPFEETPLHDMVVSNCVLWCDWGSNLKVQHAQRAGTMSQIRFRDLDCVNVDSKAIWVTTRWGSENSLIRDVTFDDIRFDAPADRLRNVYQKTDDQVFKPRVNDVLEFARVNAYSIGKPAPNQGTPGKMKADFFRFDYRDLAFRHFQVYDRPGHLIDATSPVRTKISFETVVPRQTIQDVILCGLPARTEIVKKGNVSDVRTEIDFQAQIDAVSAAGGGRVVVPAGRHVTSELFLRSNVELHLERGAWLEGSPRADDYTFVTLPYSEGDWAAVVSCYNVTNIAITGEGTISGNGSAFPQMSVWSGDAGRRRPRGLFFNECKGVRLENFVFRDAAMWGIVFKCSEDVFIRGLTIDSMVNLNNDGIDVEAKNVVIRDCDIDCGDDAVCIKSNNPDFVVENIFVSNVVARSQSNMLKLGTASHGTMRNVHFVDCRVEAPRRDFLRRADSKTVPTLCFSRVARTKYLKGHRADEMCGLAGLAVENVDGGVVEDVSFKNVTVKGCAVPIFVRGGTRLTRKCGIPPNSKYVFRNILFENITTESGSWIANSVTGVEGCRVKNVTLRNVHLLCRGAGVEMSRKARADVVPECEGKYPECCMFNHQILPAYGLYARHVDGLVLDNVTAELQDGTEDVRDRYVLDDVTDCRGLPDTAVEASSNLEFNNAK
ncbi:MAG: glycosyl hydrolase family 28 protein [bacterium]|nr:glycosyl hydrolase family 28 protein [bacterium]